jgi:hypothetical protein
LLDKQREAVEGLGAALPPEEFADRRLDIEQVLTGTHSIMATFRYVFTQRRDTKQRAVLDAADLIAAECYRDCMQRANRWRGLSINHYREPPLTYFNAMLSPAAITRRHALNKVGLQLYSELERQLPISLISIPVHDVVGLWTFCSLYHEVGHLLDNDIGLRSELSDALQALAAEGAIGAERVPAWRRWVPEMLADAFGVLLGGAGFGYAIANLLVKPSDDVRDDRLEAHPIDYVRLRMVGAMLRATLVDPLPSAAKEIEDAWTGRYGGPGALAGYVAECDAVARQLLATKLVALNDHALREFAPNLDGDHRRARQLAEWLRDRQADEPAGAAQYPFRLVPGAVQLSVKDVVADHDAQYAAIQQRALEFFASIERPAFLALELPGRRQFLRQLTKGLTFRGLDPEV